MPLFLVEKDGLYGYIDKQGHLRIAYKFKEAYYLAKDWQLSKITEVCGVLSTKTVEKLFPAYSRKHGALAKDWHGFKMAEAGGVLSTKMAERLFLANSNGQ